MNYNKQHFVIILFLKNCQLLRFTLVKQNIYIRVTRCLGGAAVQYPRALHPTNGVNGGGGGGGYGGEAPVKGGCACGDGEGSVEGSRG